MTERINEKRERQGRAPLEADSQEALDIAARETRAANSSTSRPPASGTAGAMRQRVGLDTEQLAGVLRE